MQTYALIFVLLSYIILYGCASHFTKAEKYRTNGESTLAIEEYQKEIQENPENRKARLQLGLLYFKAGNESNAVDQFESVASGIYFDDIAKQAGRLLGDIYFKKGKLAAAIRHLEVITRSLTATQEDFATLGSFYIQAKRWSDAISSLEKEREYFHDEYIFVKRYAGKVLLNNIGLGVSYLEIKSYAVSKVYFEKALDIDPTHRKSIINLNYVNLQLEKINENELKSISSQLTKIEKSKFGNYRLVKTALQILNNRPSGNVRVRVILKNFDQEIAQLLKDAVKKSLDFGAIEIVDKDSDVTFEIEKKDVDWVVSNESEKVIYSQYRSGTIFLPNPEYNSIVNRINQATNSPVYQSNSKLANNLSSTIRQYSINKLYAQLNSTPQVFEKDTYTDYSYSLFKETVNYEYLIQLDIYDSKIVKGISSSSKVSAGENFQFQTGFHPKDRERGLSAFNILTDKNDFLKRIDRKSLGALTDILESDNNILLNIIRLIKLKKRESDNNRILETLEIIGKELPKAKIASFKSKGENSVIESVTTISKPNFKVGNSIVATLYAGLSPSVVTVESSGGSGSGFPVETNIIVTNKHVVENSDIVKIVFKSKKSYVGRVIKKSKKYDIAFIKLISKKVLLNAMSMDTNLPQIGSDVIVIGSPIGLSSTVTKGIVSQIREINTRKYIQTDASINPGNSGGPIIDMNGQVVGINTSKIVAENVEGIAFAIPSYQIVKELPMLIK